MIDLRSDTVTKPTPSMRKAMFEAEVGDDDYGEDPTVNRLQEKVAELLGKQAALFVPSGTMGNQICLALLSRPGTEIITEERSHIYNYEMGAHAVLAGVTIRPIKGDNGILNWDMIKGEVRKAAPYFLTPTSMIALENTHNMSGGRVTPINVMTEICDEAHARDLRVHLDGARLFNAAIALNTTVAEIAKPFDSVMFCLSKGLGAPVGSMIAGDADFIEEAVFRRKMYGGGMRQAGILAAAGLVALDESVEKLSLDHEKAKTLAIGLANIPGIVIDPEAVQTNIVIFDVSQTKFTTVQMSAELKKNGVIANAVSDRQMRMVTNYHISNEDIERTLQIVHTIIKN